MAEAGRGKTRRDSKRRVLRPGESIRADGKYQYKYHIDGKPHFVYSWKLEPTDKLPPGKKPCLSLRELEKQVNSDLDRLLNITDGNMTVCELVDRYLKTKTGVRQSTRTGYVTVQRVLAKEPFAQKKIRSIKTSDAKLFLIKLQQEDRKSYSSIHNIRGVLRPAFQMADLLFLVTTPEVATVRNIKSSLLTLDNLNYPKAKIKVLLNKADAGNEIKAKDVESTLNASLFASLPLEHKLATSSLNKGIPVVLLYPRAKISRAFNDLSRKLSDADGEDKNK